MAKKKTAKIEYDVWAFESYDARREGDLEKARKVGTVSSFGELTILSDDTRGPLGYTKKGTQEIISYADMMASWGESPWAEKNIGQLISG